MLNRSCDNANWASVPSTFVSRHAIQCVQNRVGRRTVIIPLFSSPPRPASPRTMAISRLKSIFKPKNGKTTSNSNMMSSKAASDIETSTSKSGRSTLLSPQPSSDAESAGVSQRHTAHPLIGTGSGTSQININGPFFTDSSGRRLLLRGVNLSAGKSPLNQPSHIDPLSHSSHFIFTLDSNSTPNDSHEPELSKLNFDGTPLNLRDIDVHLARLRGWGFNCIRYVVPWEAIESEGP